MEYEKTTVEGFYLFAYIAILDRKIERSRTVYDIITLIAEVSGFADIFMITLTFLLGLFHHPKMYESALIEHLETNVVIKKKKQNPKVLKNKTVDKDLLKSIILEFRSRIKLQFNVWTTLVARYIPQQWRSPSTNLALKLAD